MKLRETIVAAVAASLLSLAIVNTPGCQSTTREDMLDNAEVAEMLFERYQEESDLLKQDLETAAPEETEQIRRQIEKIDAEAAKYQQVAERFRTQAEQIPEGTEGFDLAAQGTAAFLTSAAPVAGPFAPYFLAGAAVIGGVGNLLGRRSGRRRGVDSTLEAFEKADEGLANTRIASDTEVQKGLLRAGGKDVADGVGRLVARQGAGK